MGSEHSAHLKQSTMSHQSEKQANLYRQHTIANPGGDLEERPGSTSPGPSICSDSDLPYISYTVNRPIGDSPKLSNRQLVKSKVTHRKTVQKYIKKSVHNIVVVKPPISGPNVEKDPDILHLAVRTQSINFKIMSNICFIEHSNVFTNYESHFKFACSTRS